MAIRAAGMDLWILYRSIIPDHLLNPTGVFKERLSQSALAYAASQVSKREAEEVYRWLRSTGMKFRFGRNPETDLTKDQVIEQCRMYVAAVRIAHQFGCDLIGIQYQQGLKDTLPASDLVEGMLNNSDRPPVKDERGRILASRAGPVANDAGGRGTRTPSESSVADPFQLKDEDVTYLLTLLRNSPQPLTTRQLVDALRRPPGQGGGDAATGSAERR